MDEEGVGGGGPVLNSSPVGEVKDTKAAKRVSVLEGKHVAAPNES